MKDRNGQEDTEPECASPEPSKEKTWIIGQVFTGETRTHAHSQHGDLISLISFLTEGKLAEKFSQYV
jgi:hypothetical protein